MGDKPFKTYGQQMKYLRDKKNILCNGSNDKTILTRSGYFNLVNGYKTPFVQGVDSQGNHIYIGKTSISHLFAVKQFDDDLRHILLKYLTAVEEEIRTLVGHKFDFVNEKGKINWFDMIAYDQTIEKKKIIKVITSCYNDIERSHQDYVKHYLEIHSLVPTWILVKTINFSTFIDFLEICNKSISDSVCTLYSIYDDNNNPDKELLISMLHMIRKVRNACAHNERIYCIHRSQSRVNQPFKQFLKKPNNYTRNRTQRIIDLIIYFRYFMDDKTYSAMLEEIKEIFLTLQPQINPNVFSKIRAETGIRSLQILDDLAKTTKKINYNKFETY